jgi:hypothetical protein
MQILGPAHPRSTLLPGGVVAKGVELDAREFGPAARFEVLVGLLEKPVKVMHHAFHFAAVDEVEFLRVGPFAFEVIDFELEVWRDPCSSC